MVEELHNYLWKDKRYPLDGLKYRSELYEHQPELVLSLRIFTKYFYVDEYDNKLKEFDVHDITEERIDFSEKRINLKSILIKNKFFILNRNLGISPVTIGYFVIDNRNEYVITDDYQKEALTRIYESMKQMSIDNKLWTISGDLPSEEILDKAYDILTDPGYKKLLDKDVYSNKDLDDCYERDLHE
jgi:hypothetical protein